MILYGAPVSPYVRKVMIFCAEAGIDFQLKPTRPHSSNPDFCAASPFGRIPAMDDDGFCLADSSAIVHYLHAKHGTGLIPADPKELGRVVWFDEVGDTVLFGAMQPIFWNRVVMPVLNRLPGDEAAADKAEKEALPPVLDWLEGVIPNNGFLLGDTITLADVAIASPMANYRHIYGSVDAARYPRLAAYVDRMFDRASIAQLFAAECETVANARAAAATG